MATIKLTGKILSMIARQIGDITIRQTADSIIISPSRGKSSQPSSEAQKKTRANFRAATTFARKLDATQYARYERMAKRLKLPNAYTAAVKDYLTKNK